MTAERDGYRVLDEDPDHPSLGLVSTKRVTRDESCPYCQLHQPGAMYPPHDASPRCESGGHPHCTCDTCF
jgi:hypothetical protein